MNLSSGKTMSLGFSSVAVEDSCTLLDNVISMIDELSSVYEDDPNEKEAVSRKILHKMFAVMSDRCFKHWSSGSESATCRYVRTACDVLGPRGDAKNGCKHLWEAFLQEKEKKKSKITSFRMNRLNNFFLGAATLLFHAEEIEVFLSNYRDNLNLKLESVLADCKCSSLKSLLRALGMIYYKVTGPF